ncbi:type-F conjugative transfer system mating-pair stabilization protein TraN [Erwinia sp. JH02]|uniref:type-F conjugative transfer system mating-pair stabilization protein TraN n=1 Tax=Erwinia sp. JH02 TaxID=2733394 RepID=UPI001489B149|nr:type-F conjugative transfer system mating-pair stabilization protein TraN [Erwinia sp. JH02]NNS09971.1 type-F conjugative transfer system mating-pair stabilization protein TraN [Erwinia sp. JH02]
MKKAVISLLLLLCPLVHADPVSDAYKDGASTGKSNSGQGTGALSGGDPSSFIPGYTSSPPQTGYYGGVQGGDGGISDKGLAEFTNGDAGKAVTDSATKNPPVTLDPNADYIQTGKNAEANAGTMVDGTSAQCTEKVVSKTTFQDYSCDRDVAVVQTCGRTAGIVLTGSKETQKTTLVLNAREGSVVREANWVVRYDFVMKEGGTISSGTASFGYPSDSGYHGGRLDYTVSFRNGSRNLNYNRSGSMNFTTFKVAKGDIVSVRVRSNTDGHEDSYRDTIISSVNSGRFVIKVTVPFLVERDTTKSSVGWSESCGFDKSTAIAQKETTCVDPGGTRSITQDGKTYTETSDCWEYSDTYITPTTSTGTCSTLMNDKNCTRSGTACTQTDGGVCTHQSETWQCQKTYTSGGLLCGDDYFCKTGDCGGTDGAGDSGFDLAVAKLAGLASAGDDVKNGDQIDIKAFTGQSMACRKAMAGFSNCCVDSGWGNSAGVANCSSEEMAIGKAKAKKVTVLVGEACNHKVAGICIQKKQVYCVFGGKLARIIQEQGRRDQLHISFGEGDDPNCRGITVPELQAINFDKINFSDFYSDLMDNQKIPDTEAMTKIAKERIAAQVNQQTTGSSK